MPVYRDKKRNKYYYSFSHNGKRIRSKDFDNKRDCDKALARALLEADKIATSTYTFSQVATIFLKEKEARMKRQSFDRLGTMLGHFLATLGDVRIDKLTVKQYEHALDYLDTYSFHGKLLKNSYKNKVIRTFKQLCKFAFKRYNLLTTVPDRFDNYRNEEKEEMHFITLEQFEQFISVVDDDLYRCLFIVLFYMGFRIGEANALQWQDIDFEANTISINKTVTTRLHDDSAPYVITSPKTKSSVRTLPMPQIVRDELFERHEQFIAYRNYSPQRFVFGFDRPVPDSSLQKKKRYYFERAGIEPIRLHDFRHSCASFLINNNATPLLVSKWLGHSDVSMTLNTYSHLWKSELDQIVGLIDEKTEKCTQKCTQATSNIKKTLVS